MKKKVFMLLFSAVFVLSACGSTKAPAGPSGSREVSVSVQEEVKTPELAQKPTETAKPEVVATPAPTIAPKETAAPAATATPAPASQSQATATPVPVVQPQATATPAPTITPKETAAPAVTATPAPASQPQATSTPAPVEQPQVTVTPEPAPEATPEPVHTCSFDSGTVTEHATCNAEGTMTYSCSCGATRTESIPKTTHNYVSQTTEATCTADGYTQEVCTNCGDTKGGSSIGALGHNYEKVYPMGNNTDCRGGSYYAIICSHCDDVRESGHDDPLPCDFNETVVLAGDCVTPDLIEYTCKMCGISHRELADTATGDHDWYATVEAPTIDEVTGEIVMGKEITQCGRCGTVK